MNVLVNGGLNLSELDDWWAEAGDSAVGWALGSLGAQHPADMTEAVQLYQMLEKQIAAAFYDRGPGGIPRAWLARVRASMTRLTARFSSNRMVREYTELLGDLLRGEPSD